MCNELESVRPPGPANDNLVARDVDIHVIGKRLGNHALGGGEDMEFDEILLVDESAYRREAGDHQKIIFGVRVADAVLLMGLLERNR